MNSAVESGSRSKVKALAARMEWDDRYVETCSTRTDLEIMFATIGAVFATPGNDDDEE